MCESFSIIQPVRFMKVLFLALPFDVHPGHRGGCWCLVIIFPPGPLPYPTPQPTIHYHRHNYHHNVNHPIIVCSLRGVVICIMYTLYIQFFSSPLVLLLLYCLCSVYCGVYNNITYIQTTCSVHSAK